mmetsp:Transcript_41016/g.86190  ORF Transcript_41016/g.86190 Transcript_41016/m.86190 type:complete len:94 (+) Transcript_41016:1151-1432(+)
MSSMRFRRACPKCGLVDFGIMPFPTEKHTPKTPAYQRRFHCPILTCNKIASFMAAKASSSVPSDPETNTSRRPKATLNGLGLPNMSRYAAADL